MAAFTLSFITEFVREIHLPSDFALEVGWALSKMADPGFIKYSRTTKSETQTLLLTQ